jgi:hypothetical protein
MTSDPPDVDEECPGGEPGAEGTHRRDVDRVPAGAADPGSKKDDQIVHGLPTTARCGRSHQPTPAVIGRTPPGP